MNSDQTRQPFDPDQEQTLSEAELGRLADAVAERLEQNRSSKRGCPFELILAVLVLVAIIIVLLPAINKSRQSARQLSERDSRLDESFAEFGVIYNQPDTISFEILATDDADVFQVLLDLFTALDKLDEIHATPSLETSRLVVSVDGGPGGGPWETHYHVVWPEGLDRTAPRLRVKLANWNAVGAASLGFAEGARISARITLDDALDELTAPGGAFAGRVLILD